MNATKTAFELACIRDDQNAARLVYDLDSAALVAYMKTVKDSCTHLHSDDTSAITAGIDGLYDFCTGCGTTF